MDKIHIIPSEFNRELELQLAYAIKAGFPSPAEDYQHDTLDFNRDLIKQPDHYTVGADEQLHGVIALGYGLTQGVQHPVRPTEKYYRSAIQPVPEWFLRGMEAAMLAPTAMHMQKFEFELLADGRVAARTRFSLVNNYLKIDLGIVKCHFELGAGSENVRWA